MHTLLFIKPADMVDAATFLRAVYRCPQAPDPVRVNAASSLLRYEISPHDRRAACQLNLPAATTVEIARGNIQVVKLNYDLGRLGQEEAEARIAQEEASIRALLDTELEHDFRVIENVIEAGQAPVTVSTTGGLPPLPRPAGEPEMIVTVNPPPPAPDPSPWGAPEPDDEAKK
jgi:hypothetical protein